MKKLLLILLLCPQLAFAVFPTGWGRTAEIIIQSSEVVEDLTDFPVLITEANIPTEAFGATGSNQALDGGGDVRFSSDAAGATRLSVDTVSWDSAGGTAEVWVKVPSISSSANTSIYIWYHKSGETQPARTAAYGAEDVWSNGFNGVWHLEEDNAGVETTASVYSEMTSNSMTAGDSVSSTSKTGKIGNGQGFDGTNDYVWVDYNAAIEPSPAMSLTIWQRRNGAQPTWSNIISKTVNDGVTSPYVRYVFQYNNTSDTQVRLVTGYTTGTQIATNFPTTISDVTWYYLAASVSTTNDSQMVYSGATALDSAYTAISSSLVFDSDNTDDLWFGAFKHGTSIWRDFPGNVDEVHLSSVWRTGGWYTAENNNQSDPNAFAIEQTPSTPGGGTPSSRIMIINGG